MCLMMKFSCFHDIIESCNNNYQHFEFFAYLLLKLTIPIWLSIYGALPPFDERRTFLLNHKTTFENQLSTLNETQPTMNELDQCVVKIMIMTNPALSKYFVSQP